MGGILANLLVVHGALGLNSIPPGSEIRPMGLGLLVGLATLGGSCVGLPLSVVGTVTCTVRRHWIGAVLGLIAIGLSLLPNPLYHYISNHIVHARHLNFAP
jgi:hypothetical protein